MISTYEKEKRNLEVKKSANQSSSYYQSVSVPDFESKSIVDSESFISIQDGPASLYPNTVTPSNYSK